MKLFYQLKVKIKQNMKLLNKKYNIDKKQALTLKCESNYYIFIPFKIS